MFQPDYVDEPLKVSFSPHAWGCSDEQEQQSKMYQVLPTCVGMFRTACSPRLASSGSPHMRGDVPPTETTPFSPPAFSPHAWGCSADGLSRGAGGDVLPTCVGMFRASTSAVLLAGGSPHMRGDVPYTISTQSSIPSFSPHAWGCSGPIDTNRNVANVLPTCVGMFRKHIYIR